MAYKNSTREEKETPALRNSSINNRTSSTTINISFNNTD
ncbi:hypothetical protein Vi05172_g7508 [Venturia inaequalis]|nr:hypothetical protein Vi05172_g7508 [Venturia inaequalis]